MRRRVKTTRFTMTDEVEKYLDKKIESLESFFEKGDPAVLWEVELEKVTKGQQTGKIFRAEFNLKIKGELYRAEALGENMMVALDKAKDELKQELRKRHSKKKDSVKRGGQKVKKFLRRSGS